MRVETHRRAAELFSSACDLELAEQRALVARLIADEPEVAALLSELLDRDRAPDLRLSGAALERAAVLDARVPERIGRFRVLERLGEGGMGVVYEAEQDQPRRRVALKLLRAGFASPELHARFEREIQALGRLRHPGIAHVYEAGWVESASGPRPYFAMELVRGETLVRHAAARRASVHERLELVARIGDAVQHAHEAGVIHRDLKPSNVLVDERGDPRVLDFGVARLARAEADPTALQTHSGDLVGTLAYMSPEQIEADPARIDARADVYALGVITYELLAGRLPSDVAGKPLHEAARVIVEEDPPSLGTVDRRLRGDVETIVAKAIAKEPERRYASAAELSADIRRFLADEPIVARPPTTTYHLRKFARRNRALVGGVGGIIAALAIGLVASARMYLRADEARAAERDMRTRAEETAAVLRETNATFLGLLEAPNPYVEGVDVKLVDVLDSAAERIDSTFADRPRQRAELLRTLGRTYAGIGSAERAIGLLEGALALQDERSDPEEVARLRQELASARFDASDFAGALSLADRALADLDLASGVPAAETVASLERTRARVLLELGRVEESETVARSALARLQAAGDADEGALDARQILVHALTVRGAYGEAEELCRLTLSELETAGRSESATASMAMNTLGLVLHKARRNAEAVPWLERALAGTRKLAGDDHPLVATQINNLATLLRGVGEFERAEALYREALAMSRARWTPPHADIAYKLGNLGSLLGDTGRTDEALALLDEADRMLVELLGPRSLQRAFNSWYRGSALVKAAQYDEAIAEFESTLDIRRELLPPIHQEIAGVHTDLGSASFYQGDFAASARHYRAAREIWLALEGESSGRVFSTSVALAVALAEGGQAGEGVEVAEAALRGVKLAFPQRGDLAALHGADLGWCLFRAGRADEARARIESALPVIVAAYGEEHAFARRQRERLAQMKATGD